MSWDCRRPWHAIIPPNSTWRVISNFGGIGAMQSMLLLVLTISTALFATAPSLTLSVKRIMRGVAIISTVATLVLQGQLSARSVSLNRAKSRKSFA